MNWKVLFNPFEKYSEKTLLIFGISATLLGSLVGYLMNARFDGIIDMHLVQGARFQNILLDNLINTLVLFILFFAFGKIINPKTRAIDMLNVSMICRIPMYLVALGNIGGYLERATQNIMEGVDLDNLQNMPEFELLDLLVILIFSILSIGFLIWMIVLFWKGFKTATNTKRTRDIILFIILFIVAEVLSKYLIGTFNF